MVAGQGGEARPEQRHEELLRDYALRAGELTRAYHKKSWKTRALRLGLMPRLAGEASREAAEIAASCDALVDEAEADGIARDEIIRMMDVLHQEALQRRIQRNRRFGPPPNIHLR
jgi:hypothetical protein